MNTWQRMAPREYGFYANVNPEVESPALEPGERAAASASSSMRKTVMFNGYGEQVASLYTGLDLKKNF